MGCIYKATSPTGKSYVGYSMISMKERKRRHRSLYKNSHYSHYKFYRSLKKHGFDSFLWNVIRYSNDIEELKRLEVYYINKLNTYHDGMNSTTGGDGSHNYKFTPKQIEKHSKLRIGKLHKQETKDKIAKAMLGRKHSEESKHRMAAAKMGELNPNFGRPKSPESIRKMKETIQKKKLQKLKETKECKTES